MRRLIGRTLVVGLLASAALALAGPNPAAAANIALVSTDPPNGATLAAPPERITLVFDREPSKIATTVSVLGPNGENAKSGEIAIDGEKAIVGFRPPVTGKYIVAWGTTAEDSDPVGNAFTFTLTGLARPSGQPSASVSAADDPAEAADDEPAESPTPWWPYAVGAVVLVALLVGGCRFVWQRLRR
jgi:methionine-rich copper-binding protein CopC